MSDLLSQAFATAGKVLRATPSGFKCAYEPAHASTSGTCVSIDTGKGVWYCHSCGQDGGVVEAIMSLQGLARIEAEALLAAQGGQSAGTAATAAPKMTQAELLVESAWRADFFHDEQGDPWAVVPVNTHHETLRVHDRNFRRWLVRGMYTATGRFPNAEAIAQALAYLEAKAVFDGPERRLAWRVAQQGDTVLYDLADAEWQVVTITPQGWTITQQPGVFRRGSNTAPQVEPQAGGHLADVLQFLPPMRAQDQLLVQVYLVTGLVPSIAHPIPVIIGQKGAAKSTFSRVLRRLVDPAHEELLTLPKDQNELALLLSRNYMPVFDNLDVVQPWQSDMLCRASTGGGISKRRLYTDEEEVVLSFRRCAVLNGIQPGVSRPDLLDRAIPQRLERIAPTQRQEEREFWAAFEAVRPRILGAMFTALSQAMGIYPIVRLSGLPRMADFCTRGYAVAEALGGQGDTCLAAYLQAIGDQNTAALESHPVATAVLALLGGTAAIAQQADAYLFWEGPAADLLNELEKEAVTQRIDTKAKSWPKAAHILTRRLNEVKSNLLDIGVHVESKSDGTTRRVAFRKCTESSVRSVSSVKGTQNQFVSADATPDATDATASPSDATLDAVESEANRPLYNELEE